VTHLIQTDGIIKEYNTIDSPTNLYILWSWKNKRNRLCFGNSKSLKQSLILYGDKISNITLHDIINPETEESTHVKRWIAVDRDGYVFIYYEKPKRLNEGNSGTWDGPRQLSDEYILYPSNGQTWEDEPRPVWIEIP
jgi:hypothetical protein